MKPLDQFDEHDLIKWDSQQEWNQLCDLLNSLGYKLWGHNKYEYRHHDQYFNVVNVHGGWFPVNYPIEPTPYKADDYIKQYNSLFNEII